MMLALVPGSPAALGLMLTAPRVSWNPPETCTLQTLTVHYGVPLVPLTALLYAGLMPAGCRLG